MFWACCIDGIYIKYASIEVHYMSAMIVCQYYIIHVLFAVAGDASLSGQVHVPSAHVCQQHQCPVPPKRPALQLHNSKELLGTDQTLPEFTRAEALRTPSEHDAT